MQIFENGRFFVGEGQGRLTEERSTEDKLLMSTVAGKRALKLDPGEYFCRVLEDGGVWRLEWS